MNNSLQEQILRIVFAFNKNDNRREAIRDLSLKVGLLETALKEIIDKEEPGLCNHRGNLPCCIAYKTLEKIKIPLSPTAKKG